MSINESEESYLTVAEVAETLKLNQQTVRNWIEPGIPGSIHYLNFRVISTGFVTGWSGEGAQGSRFG